MSLAAEQPLIDPGEIQAWPPEPVAQVLASCGRDYAYLLERLARHLMRAEPDFRASRQACLAAYLHPHNVLAPLDSERFEYLQGMLEAPDTLDMALFETWVPLVVLKATTLATETYVHNHLDQVVAAVPRLLHG
ncbi:MAG: hypothetical protein VKP62_13385 [Candidatus Sericytochromatia bacterium]|nr:hypothetical protein [Candidatus Sericytochromatia bacterium]